MLFTIVLTVTDGISHPWNAYVTVGTVDENCHKWDVPTVTWMGRFFIIAIYNCPNCHGWYVPSMECICHGWDGIQKLSQMARPSRDMDGTFFVIIPIVSWIRRPNRDISRPSQL